jgi:hypothetical protein
MDWSRQSRKVCHANPLDISCRGSSRNLRALIRPNLSPAATHPFHVSALPMHRPTASTLLMAHGQIGQARHDWRGCGEQEKNRDNTSKAAHRQLQYSGSSTSHALKL